MIVNFLVSLMLAGFLSAQQVPIDLQPADPIQAQVSSGPRLIDNHNLGIKTTAPYVVAVDVGSGLVLYDKNMNLQSSLASITKLMAALTFLGLDPQWDKRVTILSEDMREGNISYVAPGEVVTVRDLFSLSLIASSNEATIALARSTGLTLDEFTQAMNTKAKELGLKRTAFVEPTGLEPANISTAYETAQFTRAALDHPEIQATVTQTEYETRVINSGRRILARTTDRLLNSFLNNIGLGYSLIGAKTGFTHASQYCFTTEIEKDGHRVILTLLGSRSDADRWSEAKGLADWIFTNFSWPE